ncbi:hypothetical protein HZA55_04510 [Candidatus Poribacteria bacterium]|nr:hypothetical protein [Candidatus Poribacteria bacterium]
MPYRIKRYIPNDFRKENYQIAEKLFNMAYDRQIKGLDFSNIFWAAQNIQNLKESITEVAKRNELKEIRNVDDNVIKLLVNL